jgi:hypothetical protein
MDRGDFSQAIGFLQGLDEGEDENEVDEHERVERRKLMWKIRRSEFLRLVLTEVTGSKNVGGTVAEGTGKEALPITVLISFVQKYLQPFYDTHQEEIHQLVTSTVFTPLSRLLSSAYGHFYTPYLHLFVPPEDSKVELQDPDKDIKRIFLELYCVEMGLARYPPLKVVTDVGNGSNVAMLMKARSVMSANKNEWTQENELPVSTSSVCYKLNC